MKVKWLLVMHAGTDGNAYGLRWTEAGCIYIYDGPNGFPSEAGEKLEVSLKSKVGEAPTVEADIHRLFSHWKK